MKRFKHYLFRVAGGALPWAAGGAVLLTFWLWFSLLSPWVYTPPTGLPAIDESVEHRVFAYGTLRYSLLRWVVTGRRIPSQPAILPGFRKDALNVVPVNGTQSSGGGGGEVNGEVDGEVKGEVFEVSPEELRRLDRYERLGVRYERIALTLDDGEGAWVYRRLPGP